MLDGQLMVGNWLSTTVILKEQTEVFPPASVALNVMILVAVGVPFGKAEPLAKPVMRATVTPEQLSVAVGVAKVWIEVQRPVFMFTVRLGGQAMLGNWLSTTVTLNEQAAVSPLPSVAFQVTTVMPRGKDEPLFRPVRRASVGGGEQLSDALMV